MIRYFLSALILITVVQANAKTTVRTVDLLGGAGIAVNAAGPVLVQMDEGRNRLIVANTLTSSLSIIDCSDHSVENIPLAGRALQHLKAASMTISKKTGDIYLVGANCVLAVSASDMKSRMIPTDVQFESITVDEQTGNVFVAGRESKGLGYLKKGSDKVKTKKWCETSEPLINLNQTPPPPIRRVIADNARGEIVALDGYTSTLYLFSAKDGKLVESRPLGLTSGGRWHFGGYDEGDHALYLVVETDKRNVIEAAKIDIAGVDDVIVELPGLREGVGIIYNPARKEVYVPYDNHPTVHVVNFDDGGEVDEIKIPAYGNDASAVDSKNDLLYIGSWAFGEVDVIDLKTRKMLKRIEDLGIIPHMFTMAFNSNNGLIYFPKGASAVNGTFGAAVTALDPNDEGTEKIRTGWAPIDLIDLPDRNSVLVFNSEDQFAEVRADGTFDIHTLPYDYPVAAIHNAEGDVYVSYGPHQSYWPTVYIWGAKNGVLGIDSEDFSFYDRRIPRQAHEMALDGDGILYFTQNNWGREEQFVGVLKDPVRVYENGDRLGLEDEVEREITQRILAYDPGTAQLYLVRVGEKDEDPSVLQVIDPVEKKVVARVPLGITATDLVFDDRKIYVANFGSSSVSVIDKSDFTANDIETAKGPLRLCSLDGRTYVISHMENRFQELGGKSHKIPFKGLPDNIFAWGDIMILTSHNDESMAIMEYDPDVGAIKISHRQEYPYGDVRFDTPNVSFYVQGQFGDAVFEITRGVVDANKRLWISDFLAGKLYIVESN